MQPLPAFESVFAKRLVAPTFGDSQWREPILLWSVTRIFFKAKSPDRTCNPSYWEKNQPEQFRCVLCSKTIWWTVYDLIFCCHHLRLFNRTWFSLCVKKQYERNSSVVHNVIFNLFSLNCNIIVLARTFKCSPCSFLILILIGISSVEICKFRSDFSSSYSSEKMETVSVVIKKEEETEDCRTYVFHEESCAEIIKHER